MRYLMMILVAAAMTIGCASRSTDDQAKQLYERGRAIEQQQTASPIDARKNLRAARDTYYQGLDLKPRPNWEGLFHAGIGNTSYWLDDYSTAASEWPFRRDGGISPGPRQFAPAAPHSGVAPKMPSPLRSSNRPVNRHGGSAVDQAGFEKSVFSVSNPSRRKPTRSRSRLNGI